MPRLAKPRFARKAPASPVPRPMPGAARSLPLRLLSRVPVLGRLGRSAPPPLPSAPPHKLPVRMVRALLPRRLKRWMGGQPPLALPSPPTSALEGVLNRMRQPLSRTARVVNAAREVRRPKTRWERLREAALQVMDDPVAATRWEQLMTLGMGLAQGRKPQPPRKRSALERIVRGRAPEGAPETPGLAARLLPWKRKPKKNAGPGNSRNRRALVKPRRSART